MTDPSDTTKPSRLASIDADRFNKFAGGLQSIVTALGIIIAGVWVLFTFRHLGTAEKSRAELAALEIRQRETQETLTERQPILAIDLISETAGVALERTPSGA